MSTRIRLLHLIRGSGPSQYLSTLASRLDRKHFDVTVASLAPAGRLQRDMAEIGVRTFSLDCEHAYEYPRAIVRLRRELAESRFQIVQTHLLESGIVGLIAARLAGTPVTIFTGHHSHEVPLQRSLKLRVLDSICSRWLAHCVLAPSEQVRQVYLRWEGVPEWKIEVLPYGFDLSLWPGDNAIRTRLRAELGLDGKAVFGAVGRLYWIKNYEVLLRALGNMRPLPRDLALVIVGEGSERQNLESLTKQLGLTEHVQFLGQRSDIPDIMSAIDVFVHPSLGEAFCQVTAEAMASGRPLISSRVGGPAEMVEDGVNGYLVEPGDIDGLTKALERMLANRRSWPEMGEAARRTARRYSIDSVIPAYEELYARLNSKFTAPSL